MEIEINKYRYIFLSGSLKMDEVDCPVLILRLGRRNWTNTGLDFITNDFRRLSLMWLLIHARCGRLNEMSESKTQTIACVVQAIIGELNTKRASNRN